MTSEKSVAAMSDDEFDASLVDEVDDSVAVDLDRLRTKLDRLRDPVKREEARLLLAGEVFAKPGELDRAMQRLASVIAWAATDAYGKPASLSAADLAVLFERSMAKVAALPGATLSLDDEMAKVRDKLGRAFEDAATKKPAQAERDERIRKTIIEPTALPPVSADDDGTFPLMQIGAIEDVAAPPFLVEGLVPEQGIIINGGEPKALKSFFTTELAVAVASGTPACGKYAAKKGKVIYYNGEDNQRTTRRRAKRFCAARKIDENDLDLHVIDARKLMLDAPAYVERLEKTIKKHRPALVVLDPFVRLFSGDENSARDVAAFFDPFLAMAREYKMAFLFVHHMAKQGEVRRRSGQQLRGSSVFHSTTEAGLYNKKSPDGRITVEVELRDGPPSTFGFVLREGLVDGKDAAWLEHTEAGATDTSADDVEVLKAIAAAGSSGIGLKKLREALRGVLGKDRADHAVTRLLASNQVRQVTAGKRVAYAAGGHAPSSGAVN